MRLDREQPFPGPRRGALRDPGRPVHRPPRARSYPARFGTAGHTVALFSRNAENLDGLAAGLAREGIQARGFTADVLDLDSLCAAPYAAAAQKTRPQH
ncbi:hypothetical protein [Streptomyces sp. 3214.6]|uniref:hypothetical protein n=1 Tax=Streptomyces sp. 3214.6 TaxID=1882757 RepID=UPI0018D51F94|nr:hypothetical protein [Streptomyces sp. 3214.6]